MTVEALSGLLEFYEATNESRYLDAVVASAEILMRDAYLPAERLMLDHYSLARRTFVGDDDNALPGRAMLDDAVFARLATITGDSRYGDVFLAMADRLLEVEILPEPGFSFHRGSQRSAEFITVKRGGGGGRSWPHSICRAISGTWKAPSERANGICGPRIWTVVSTTPHVQTQKHNSFGLCTSVVAVATIFWADLYRRTRAERYLDPIRRSVGYLLAAQFRDDVPDPDVRGALFESPKAPNGTLAPGFSCGGISRRSSRFGRGMRCSTFLSC